MTDLGPRINVLAATISDTSGYFGEKDKVDPIHHLMGTAFGWGGNPKEAATYVNVYPAKNDGKAPYILTVRDVPVDGFWSAIVYDSKGYIVKNARDIYSYNNVTAKKGADGSITIHFGGDPKLPNFLPIIPGWNYIVRMYKPGPEILNGSWTFPKVEPVK